MKLRRLTDVRDVRILHQEKQSKMQIEPCQLELQMGTGITTPKMSQFDL